MKGRQLRYSAAELDYVRSVSTWARGEAHAAFCQKFARDDVTFQNFNALCKRKGWLTGRTGCFPKGNEPVNKGKPCEPGKGGRHPNARKTQFKKGGRTGKAQLNYQPIGTERITEDGYRERKMHDNMPLQSRWQLVHRVEWEATIGAIPKDHCLKCLSDDKANCDPSNWTLIPRALLPRLAGGNRYRRVLAFDDAAPELKPTVLAIATLENLTRNARRAA